jgi:ACS family hexuronate transporter-like MFS transporter
MGAAAGALLSGGLASRFLMRGHPVNRVRKLAMLASGVLVLPLPLALYAPTAWAAAGVLALVLFAHQGFSTNLFALITDTTDRRQIGRVTSFATFCGNIGGMGIVKAAGMFLVAGLGYMPLFLFAAASYLLALAWIQAWLPRIELIGSSDHEPAGVTAH